MSNSDIASISNEYISRGISIDDVEILISELKGRGVSFAMTIPIVRRVLSVNFAQAKELVHRSSAWAGQVAGIEAASEEWTRAWYENLNTSETGHDDS